MKQLTCEMCGGTDLIKDGGVFVCQFCGCKYTVEEAKKMMIEGVVEVKGTVQVDNSNQIDNLLKNIETLYSDGKYEEVYKKCDEILRFEPDNSKALLYSGFSDAWKTNGEHEGIDLAIRGFKRAIDSAKNKGEVDVIINYICFAATSMSHLIDATKILYGKLCSIEANNQGALAEYEGRMMAISSSKSEFEQHQRKSKEYLAKVEAAIDEAKRKTNKLFSKANIFVSLMIESIDHPEDCNEGIYDIIRLFLKRYMESKDLSDYSVKKECNKLWEAITELEQKGNKIRVEKYWECHQEEKENLVTKIRELDDIITSLNQEVEAFKPQINGINARKEQYVIKEEEINKQKKNVSDLRIERKNLGLFQGKRKKEIDEIISSREKEIAEKEKEYNMIKENVQRSINNDMAIIREQCKPLEEKIASVEKQKQELQEKLEKPY